jgi:signal peptide peptidase SppA
MRYPHLAARLYNSPLLVDPAKAAVIEQVFRAHLLGEAKPAANPADYARVDAAALGTVRYQNRTDKPYPLTEGGVAVISVVGTLVQRADSLDAMSGLIGYNRLERQLATAIEDPSARAILLEVDSPGGEANGCFDLAAKIIAARKAKPIWAHANEQAFSAAYAIACAAERLVAPPTGLVGSIGVIALHVDQSKRDMTQGYSYTAVYAGERKNDFTSHEPLSDAAHAILQAEVDRLYGIFVSHVARARGIDERAVRATEAGLLNPEVALKGGFIDQILGFAETVGALEEKALLNRGFSIAAQAASPTPEKENDMFKENKPAATTEPPAAPQNPTAAAAPTPAAAAAPAAPAAAAPAAPSPDAAQAERARITAILGCEEAKGRASLAQHLALETSMGVEDAKKMLAKAAVEGAGKGGQFGNAMAQIGNPKVGADTGDELGAGKPSINTSAIYASRRPEAVK